MNIFVYLSLWKIEVDKQNVQERNKVEQFIHFFNDELIIEFERGWIGGFRFSGVLLWNTEFGDEKSGVFTFSKLGQIFWTSLSDSTIVTDSRSDSSMNVEKVGLALVKELWVDFGELRGT